jgi:xylan 1,4-beta-xylosidase
MSLALLLVCILLVLANCTTEAPPLRRQLSTHSSATVSTTTLVQPTSSEITSWFKPELYTGIPSPLCRPPVTSIGNLPAPSVKLTVDVEKSLGKLDHDMWSNIGGTCAFHILNEDNRSLWELNRATGIFQYTRTFGVLSDGMNKRQVEGVKRLLQEGKLPVSPTGRQRHPETYYVGCQIYSEDENGNPKYNFWHLDRMLDTLLSARLRPVFQCNMMPDALVSGEKLRCADGGLVNTPNDYRKWRDLIYNIVKHCIQRYGAEEVRSWYFVLWNEPDLRNGAYFVQDSNSFSNYVKMYDFFADGAKAADAQVKVGGAELAFKDWFKSFLKHCVNGTNTATGGTGAPLYVISWHQYGTVEHLLAYNRDMMKAIQSFPTFKDCPTLVTEWGRDLMKMEQGELVNEVNTKDQYTSYEAAYLCKYIVGALRERKSRPSRFMRSGSTTKSTAYYRYYSIKGGQYFIPMPILNVHLLLAKMGSEQVELTGSSFRNTVFGFAARTSEGVQVLIYNFNEKDKKSKGKTKEVNLNVKGLPATWSKVKRYQVDNQNSNAWSGYPVDKPVPSMEQLMQMAMNSRLKIIEQTDRLEINEGQTTFRLNLPPNSVSLIVLGEEAVPPKFIPSPHTVKLLKEEAMYNSAKAKLDQGDEASAKAGFEQLVADSFGAVADKSSNNPYSFWGQKALYALRDLGVKQRDLVYADRARMQLLATTLTDVERFVLLNERQRYLEDVGSKDELQVMEEELKLVRRRLEYYANWSKWTRHWSEW